MGARIAGWPSNRPAMCEPFKIRLGVRVFDIDAQGHLTGPVSTVSGSMGVVDVVGVQRCELAPGDAVRRNEHATWSKHTGHVCEGVLECIGRHVVEHREGDCAAEPPVLEKFRLQMTCDP